MFGAAWASAKRTFDFLKRMVSGELTYFAFFLSFVRMRPENAMARSCRSVIVNMSRPPKRLNHEPPADFGGSSTPAATRSSSVKSYFFAHVRIASAESGAYPILNCETIASGSSRLAR